MKSYMTDRSPEVMEIMKVLGIDGRAISRFSLHVQFDEFVTVDITELVSETGKQPGLTHTYRLELIEGPNHEDPRVHETNL